MSFSGSRKFLAFVLLIVENPFSQKVATNSREQLRLLATIITITKSQASLQS